MDRVGFEPTTSVPANTGLSSDAEAMPSIKEKRSSCTFDNIDRYTHAANSSRPFSFDLGNCES
jgi:hypothetical protein